MQAILLVVSAAVPGRAEIIRSSTSVTFNASASFAGTPVSVRATLWYDPNDADFLNLRLQNTSPVDTVDPVGLLTSFYFGVYSGTTSGTAPTLVAVSGIGQVVKAVKDGPDVPGVWTPPAVAGGQGTFTPYATGLSDLRAVKRGDSTWQFRGGLGLVASEPPLNFGIGTVGNANLTPNGFNGSIVGTNDFGISSGDATTQNLQSVGLLVSGSALFRFKGFSGYSTANIPSHAVFGLGSAPDAVITVPETGTGSLAVVAAAAALGLRRRLRRRSPGTPEPGNGGAAIITPMGELRIVVRTDAEAVAREAVALWRRHAADAVATRGTFRTLLSGGSTPRRMFELLAAEHRDDPPWPLTHLFWGDERTVPPDHHDSNFRMTRDAMLATIAPPAAQVHRVMAERADADAAARDYQAAVATDFGVDPAGPPPAFDLVWLGLGTDAHTASLFPGTAALRETRRWFVANDVPQLGTRRLTATYPLLDAARAVVFLVAGADKAPAVARVFAATGDVDDAPARGVRPAGTLTWVLDEAAAKGLPPDRAVTRIDGPA